MSNGTRFRPTRLRSPRRKTSWEEGPGGTAMSSSATSEVKIMGAGAQAVVDGLTIVRTRGLLSFSLGLATAAQDGFLGAFGLCIVNENAGGIGVTAVPTPITDLGWDGWFYHTFFDIRSGVVSSSSNPGPKDQHQIQVDSKAMRKIDLGDIIFAVIEVVETGTATMDMSFNSRILLKIP